VTLIYFKLKSTSWRTNLVDFVDGFDSRHDNRRIKLRWGDDSIKFEPSLCWDLCENHIAHCLFVWIFLFRLWQDSYKSTQGWKVSFEVQSEENSVWIIKWTTLLGITCKINFTPAVKPCYQVHTLNADAHLSAALLCYFRCNWYRNLAAVKYTLHWIVLTLSTLPSRNSSCITLSWLYHNHKMSISYHKNGLVNSHQTVGRWFIFMCFVIRIFWQN